jgi:hypothetical protein
MRSLIRGALVKPARFVSLFSLALLVCSSALAVPITVNPTDSDFVPAGVGPVGGSILLGTGIAVPFTSATFHGTLTSTVYAGDASNPYGGLTFTYLLTNSNTGTPVGDIDRLTINDYAGFLVDASYQSPTSGLAPTLVDRDGPGNVMGFSFLTLPGHLGNGPLHAGMTSALMVLQTDALSFQPTLASVIDGSVTSVASFAPSANIPEPSTLVLTAIGALGLFVACRRMR